MPEHEVFQPFTIPNRPSGSSFAVSALVHGALVLLLLAWRYIGPLERLNYTPHNYEVQIIRYSVPEPLLFAAAGQSGTPGTRARLQAPPRAGEPGRGPGGRPTPAPKLARAPEAAQEAPPAPKPRFELPRLPRQQPAPRRDVILQPDFSPDMQIVGKVDLPNVFLWSQRTMRPPERQLQNFVPGQPKRVAPPKPQALPDAPPQVQLPNQEAVVSDLQVGPMAAPPERPKLPVFQANTTPVRAARRALDAPSELPATPLPPGEGTNLLAIMERPAPPAASYQVAAGNRLAGDAVGGAGAGGSEATAAPLAGGAGGGGAPGAGAEGKTGVGTGAGSNGAGGGKANGTGAGAAAGTGATDGGSAGGARAGAGTATGSGGRGSGTGAGSGGARLGTGSGSKPGGRGTDLGISGLSIAGGRVPARSESPNTSTFDLVVVNVNAREILPESPGVLTGQPVYTVFMPVPGSRREWILQFAIPNSRPLVEQKSANSVKLGAVAPVRAPFPLRKGTLSFQQVPDLPARVRVVVYALITAKGALEEVRVIRSVRSDVDAVAVACLREFSFRPATRDGGPVGVEAVFGVPVD